MINITDASASVDVDAPTLTFTPANWNTKQYISLIANDDVDDVSENYVDITFHIDVALSDDDFDGVSDETSVFHVVDNDLQVGGGGGNSSSSKKTKDPTKKTLTIGLKKTPVTTTKTVTTTVTQTTNTQTTTSTNTNTTTTSNATQQTGTFNAAPDTSNVQVISPKIPRSGKRVFQYTFEKMDVVKELGITEEAYENQCITKNGKNYYRLCNL